MPALMLISARRTFLARSLARRICALGRRKNQLVLFETSKVLLALPKG